VKAVVTITRRASIADPEGATIGRALADLGFGAVRQVRVNRTVTLILDHDDPATARADVEAMCERLLVNPVMEDFDIEIVE
jgi:phosphoribosylformylglycinamidine synthase